MAMSKASPEADIRTIEQNTIGIAFLGTPHHGGNYADWITFSLRMTAWLKRSNINIVEVLKPDSEILADIQKAFHSLLAQRDESKVKLNVVCFWEEIPVKGIGEVRLFMPCVGLPLTS